MTNASQQLQAGRFAAVIGFGGRPGTALQHFGFLPGPA